MTYVQCELRNANRVRVAWIPGKYAQEGRSIEIKERGDWEPGWIVARVFGSIGGDQIHEVRDAHKYHRQNTDI